MVRKFDRKLLAKFINELKLCEEGFSQSDCEEEAFPLIGIGDYCKFDRNFREAQRSSFPFRFNSLKSSRPIPIILHKTNI